MGDDMGLSFVVGKEGVEEGPVFAGDFVDGVVVVDAERNECFVAAVGGPEVVVLGAEGGVFHHDLVVATEVDHHGGLAVVVFFTEFDEAVEDASGFGAAIDVVADRDEGVLGGEGEGVVESVEGGEAAVDVADDVGFHVDRKGGAENFLSAEAE